MHPRRHLLTFIKVRFSYAKTPQPDILMYDRSIFFHRRESDIGNANLTWDKDCLESVACLRRVRRSKLFVDNNTGFNNGSHM